ncbi:YraN family protein [Lentisphaerota bacterium ZTH]|nr:YraN family protein [Lentisphaerota bacterium]WET06624.1 YraN family protein [Lentisphaerota bacterium ZTH]
MNFKAARARHLRLGRTGENIAVRLLRSKHLDLLCRNYKVKAGEIDIITRDGEILTFVEVKTRRLSTRSRPAAGLRFKQKRRIHKAAMNYLRHINRPEVIYRFDLIEVIIGRSGPVEVRHWPEHFSGSEIKPEFL